MAAVQQQSRVTQAVASPVVRDVLQSPGQPLETATRTFFESRFAHDFSRVRVHAGASAAAAARSMAARAFTSGEQIVFGSGQFEPHASEGRWLLAHELAHVAQKREGPGSSAAAVERDASRAATGIMRGEAVRLDARHDGMHPHCFGEPENVPEMTYISTQGDVGFLNQAAEFHQGWGLPVRRIASVEQMVGHLAQNNAPVNRIRFVTHAVEIGVFSSLFTGEPLQSLDRQRLSAYAESNAAGLAFDTAMPGLNFGPMDPIVGAIRSANANAAALLTPFGLQQTGVPSGQLDVFFRRVLQFTALQQARSRRNAAQFDPIIQALPAVIADVAARAASEIPAANVQQVLALQPAIAAAVASLGIRYRLNVPAGQAAHVRQAVRATDAGFRQQLDDARRRFTINSWIDIRGCNAGGDLRYLQSVSRFFGREGNQPHVSGPNWFQIFPTLSLRTITSDAAVNAAAADANVAEALEHWSPLTGARQQMEVLRSFYVAQIAMRVNLARQRETPPSAGLQFDLRAPVLDPLLPGLPTTAADRSAVFQLLIPRLQLPPPRLFEPNRRPLSFGALQFADQGLAIAQQALDRLNAPNAELRYYLDSALVLPVFRGGNQQNFEMVIRHQLQNEAIDRWLASQWAGDAPGLEALQRQPPNAAITRRVQALVQAHDRDAPPGAQMVFPPDPRFWEHINQI